MRLIKIIAFSFLLTVSVNMESRAFLPLPPGPFSPTVDGPTDAVGIMENLAAAAQANASQYMAYLNDLTKQAKALKSQYMDQFTGLVSGVGDKLKGAFSKEKEALPGTKTIQESQIADIYDADSVKKAMYTLFLAYPADCEKDFNACKEYEGKAKEFYQDTVIEIYTAVRQLELTIPELEATIDNLSTTFSGAGGDGAETAEDENGAWKNMLNAYETMDKILRLIEELNAMNAQYEAALFLREQVHPAAYVPQEQRKSAKTSAYMPEQTIQTASLGKYVHSETLVFGQIGMIASPSTDKAVASATSLKSAVSIMDDDEEEYEYDPELYGAVKFADAPKPPLKSVFEGNRKKLLELDKVAPVYEKSQDVKEVHNLLQALDSYRDLFESYEKFKKLHQKALQAVAAADQCAIQYLGRRYANPEKIWKGSMPDAAINDYDARQGISGWAVKAFEIAKSEDSTPIEENDLATIDIDTSMDINDSKSEEKIKADMEKKRQNGFTGFVDSSKETEAEKASRESQMISFNIGAEAAQTLVEDQYSTNPKWGAPSVKFPVWNDQINFYTQYIDGKYTNIKDYLHQLDVNTVIVDIAYELNDILTSDEEERQNNRAGLDKLSARLNREAQASDPAEVLKEMEKNRTQLLNQALQNKDKQLRSLESQKTALQSSLSRASAAKADYSEQLNTVSQDKLKAETGITVNAKQIKNLEERRGEDEDNLIRVSDVEYEEETVEISPETTKTVQKTELKETTEKKQLFDSQSVIEEYKDDVQKLQYQFQQQEAAKVKAQPQVLSPASVEKKNLFRQRPFSDNSDYAPLNTPKYSLSQTLYFGAEFPLLNKEAKVASGSVLSAQSTLSAVQNAEIKNNTVAVKENLSQNTVVSGAKQTDLEKKNAERLKNQEMAVAAKEVAKAEAKVLQTSGNIRPQVVTNTNVQAVNNGARVQLIPVATNSNKDGSLSLHPESRASAKMPALSNTALSSKGVVSAGPVQNINYFQEKAKLDSRLETQLSEQSEVKKTTSEIVSEEETVEAVNRTYTNTIRSEKMEINREDSTDMALAKLELADNAQEVENKEKKALQIKSIIDAKEQESKRLSQQIDVLENNIKAVETDYTSQIQKIEEAYNKKLEEAQKYINDKRQARETLDLISYYQSKIGLPTAGIDGLIPPFSLMNILRVATSLTDDTRSYADQLVDDAHKSIINLGDGVYVGEYGDKIQEIHSELMTKLKSLPVEGLNRFSSRIKTYSTHNAIMKPLTSLFQKMLIQKACVNDSCKKVDSDYFVGLVAKERDFMVPKAAPKEYLPPLREVIYFDDVDYENMNVAADGSVARENFLNSGSKYPEIWKRILNGKAFVDKDVDLKTLLSEGNEMPAFMRGGRYPCLLDGQIIDVKDADGQFTVYNSKALPEDATTEEKAYRPARMSSMPQCKEISVEGKGKQGKFYATVKDKVEDITAPARVAPFQSFSNGGTHSELGTLLKFTEQGLSFNYAPDQTMKHLAKMTEEAGKANSSYKQNMPDIVYQKALLKNNQFGNFLTFVEQEISYRQSLEELELRIAEAKEILFEQFDKMGFKPSATYNLAKQEDYQLTKDVLTNRRNTLLNEGFAKMEQIKVEDNEIVEERVKKIRNILTAVRKDKNAYIPLSDTVDSGAELDEQIKTEEVNHQVTEKYKKQADEEFEKQISSFPIPFCAAY